MKRKLLFVIFSLVFVFSLVMVSQAAAGNCAVKKTKLNVKKLTLTKNDTYTLRVYNLKKKYTVRFTSDNENIVSVNESSSKPKSADITAVNVGTANVRAQIYNRKARLVRTLKTNIKVTPYAISIKFQQKKVKLNSDDTMKLPVIIKPSTSQEIPLFESSNPDVVTVNSKGIITAISPGNAVITATLLSNGQKVTCKVQVTPSHSPSPTPEHSTDAGDND